MANNYEIKTQIAIQWNRPFTNEMKMNSISTNNENFNRHW